MELITGKRHQISVKRLGMMGVEYVTSFNHFTLSQTIKIIDLLLCSIKCKHQCVFHHSNIHCMYMHPVHRMCNH